MIKFLVAFFVFINLAFVAQSQVIGIIAVAGNTAISSYDLEERLRLNMALSNTPQTEQNKMKLRPQVLKTLIDEAIYREEAEKYNIKVLDSEIRQSIAKLEQGNGMPAGSFNDYIESNDISSKVIRRQLESQIIWSKLVGRNVMNKVVVTDKDIEEKMESVSEAPGEEQINISEIVLNIDSIDTKESIKTTAYDIYELLSSGADFSSTALEFSQSPTAKRGGKIGWIQSDLVSKQITQVVDKLQNGEFSEPFFANDKFYIVKLNNKRVTVKNPLLLSDIKMHHAFVPVEDINDKKITARVIKEMESKQKVYRGCDDFDTYAKLIGSTSEVGLVDTNLKKLSPFIRAEVIKTPVNELSNIVVGEKGVHIFGICEKKESKSIQQAKEELRNAVSRQKLEQQAQRYLQKLRRETFIEIRS